MRKLPLDLSTFSELIQSNYVYVDKTEYMYNMITGGRRYFLSRPRRFGKSLLVSTLREILTANKALFTDLWIGKSDYPWHEYGVIKLDFSRLDAQSRKDLEHGFKRMLIDIGLSYSVDLSHDDQPATFLLQDLVAALYKKYGKVAILIDEYDSPILKNLYDEVLAKEIRSSIQQFFTVIKSLDAEVQFVFITGVTSFAKAGLFSGINNLQILTLNKNFANICGYTDQEIDHYFSDHVTHWAQQENISYDELRERIKKWYNGYHFGKNVISVYNPFSLMHALHIEEFKNFWFQSGTPTFLVEVLKKNQHAFDPEKMMATEDSLGVFDVGLTPLTTLMFQAGYLTIVSYDPHLGEYLLDYPNNEVRISFQKYLLEVFTHVNSNTADSLSRDFYRALISKNIEEVVEVMHQLFAHVPYQLHMKAEKYYHSLFMMICVGAGIKAQSEYSTSHARIDLVLEFPKTIYVIEIKFNDTAENALAQIEERRYYERFINQGKEIILLGLAFERKPNNFNITYVMKDL